MTAPKKLASPELLAELVAEAVQKRRGAVGVLVRDVPSPDPKSLLTRLASLREGEGADLRVAYTRAGGREAIAQLSLDAALFSHEVEQAERWRNDPDLDALIVVIAHGEEAKLSSLEDFAPVSSRDLKNILVERALGEEAGQNDVQARWWRLLERDDAIGLGQLADYYLALSGMQGAEFLGASSREVFHLGLLPDPELFNDPKDRAVRLRVQSNRDLLRRLQTLTPKDRRTITKVISQESNAATKARLQKALELLEKTRWEGEGLRGLTLQDVERLVKARTSRPSPNGDGPRPQPPQAEKMVDVAAQALVDEERAGDLAEAVKGLQQGLAEVEESRLRPETIKADLPGVGTTGVATARLDVVNLVVKLLDEGVYGGIVSIEAPDLEEALRRFDAQQHVLARWAIGGIEEFLGFLAEDEAGRIVQDAFRQYDEARKGVLPLIRGLAVEPLVIAAHKDTRGRLLALIRAYEAMNRALGEKFETLFERFGSDVHEFLSQLLLLETIVLQIAGRRYALLAPTHPLYLWHYARYCEIVEAQRERLDEQDRKLIIHVGGSLPTFLPSLYVAAAAFGDGLDLPYLGRLGPLPYFGERVEASTLDDGLDSVRSLVQAQLALEPHSRSGFRLGLVDPPDPGAYLTLLADLAEEEELHGAHLSVYRHRGRKVGVELRLDEAEEERVATRFRSQNLERRFTFEVRNLPDHMVCPSEGDLLHLVVIFDCGEGRSNRARPAAQPIQPLALPRRLHYSHHYKTVELEPAPGEPFSSYDRLVKRLSQGGGSSYLSVHQEAELRKKLEECAEHVSWIGIADRRVDRDLRLGALRILTTRDGERDVAAFARSTTALRRPLRDVVRGYNAYISDQELDDLLGQLSDLLDSGLLNLKPDPTGKTNHNRIKGLLGTLIAARWFRQRGEAGRRLLISLDSPEARRWMHLSDDPLRADLVGFEWTNDHCTVSVIEVKAVQTASIEYSVSDGIAEGPAIDQMLGTRRLLGAVFSMHRADELITTPARREILREHLHRELTKGVYGPEERRLWADRLQRLLDGNVQADVRCHLVDVRLGVDSESLRSRSVAARQAEETVPVHITELNERQIEALVPPPEPDPPAGPSDGGSPPAQPGGGGERPSVAMPEDAAEPTAERQPVSTSGTSAPADEMARPRALLGTAPGTYGKERDVWFDPASKDEPLPNPHIAITGETGSGKTQATKTILADLRERGLPSLILDFKDDYSDPTYAEAEQVQVYDPTYEKLPFNPLAAPIDRRTGRVNPSHHIHQVVEIIKRIYRLGDQQAYRLREAIKLAYEHAGVPMQPFDEGNHSYPPFEAVRSELQVDKANEALLGRMSPIFDLGLFSTGETEVSFATVVARSTVVRLGQLPGDETKNSVAEFFLMALYNYLIRQAQTHTLGRLLVLDEAWRLVQSPYLEPLMREGRAFGLGVLVATQFPRDLPAAVSGSTATKLFFSQTQLEQIREIQRTIVGKTSGPEADHLAGVLRGLTPLSCAIVSKQHRPFVRLSIRPYFRRRG